DAALFSGAARLDVDDLDAGTILGRRQAHAKVGQAVVLRLRRLGVGRLLVARHLAELDRDGHGLATTHQRHTDRLAGRVAGDLLGEVARIADILIADLGDRVAGLDTGGESGRLVGHIGDKRTL